MNKLHCLTTIRFVLVLRKIHFTLDDKFHFCGICIVMIVHANHVLITEVKVLADLADLANLYEFNPNEVRQFQL